MGYVLLVIIIVGLVIYFINKSSNSNVNKPQVIDYTFIKEKEEKEKEIAQLDSRIQQMRERLQDLDAQAEKLREKDKALIQKEIDDWAKSAQEAANFNADRLIFLLQEKINCKELELSDLKEVINEYKLTHDTINKNIARARELAENVEFYTVQIPDSYKNDIEILNSVRTRLTKHDLLDKLIYDNYVRNSVNEMLKRVLQGRAPCGIYKITRLSTQEVYIGKSTDIKKRWQQHCQSAYHCGTISHSTLHTTMEKDGIWNFTWEILEEVEKDHLSEREKFWIDFYDSKNYGLNEKRG